MVEVAVIESGTVADPELREDVARLIGTLDGAASPDNLDALLADPNARLLIATDGAERVGMLTLTLRNSLTRRSAFIDHVVVDPSRRRSGIARLLTSAALELARQLGATRVELTSRPTREAAQALYRELGFEQRDTNLWRYTL